MEEVTVECLKIMFASQPFSLELHSAHTFVAMPPKKRTPVQRLQYTANQQWTRVIQAAVKKIGKGKTIPILEHASTRMQRYLKFKGMGTPSIKDDAAMHYCKWLKSNRMANASTESSSATSSSDSESSASSDSD